MTIPALQVACVAAKRGCSADNFQISSLQLPETRARTTRAWPCLVSDTAMRAITQQSRYLARRLAGFWRRRRKAGSSQGDPGTNRDALTQERIMPPS